MSFNGNAAAAQGSVWLDANRYYDAERRHYEISLADLVNEALKRPNPGSPVSKGDAGIDVSQSPIQNRLENFEKEQEFMKQQIEMLSESVNKVLSKLASVEIQLKKETKVPLKENKNSSIQNGASTSDIEDDEDLDLFGSDEENVPAPAVQEHIIPKKAKKPPVIAKSSVVLDIKPWDDETDMKAMEKAVRSIQTEGLLWGASKLVPLAFGINKLQVVAIVEDEKVSIDWLQETINEFEDLVQSVDIAAFNKL